MAFAPRRANPGLAKKRRAQSTAKNEGKVVLERVLGLTCVNNSSLAVSSTNHCIAYPAGCTVILFYSKKNRQCHIINPSRKTVSCLCIASDKYLAYGECGHFPCVRICDISSSPPVEITKLAGHTFGVSCVAFSPNLRYLVSVGYQHDQNVFVWNWKSNIKLATNKITTKVSGISFSEDGKYFVTVGSRRIRYWYFDTTIKDTKNKTTLPLNGRSAILGDQQNKVFASASCGQGSFAKYTYAVTTCGSLFQFNENREVNKMLSVQAGKGYCVAVTPSHVVVGCADGVIRLFNPLTLDYVVSLPRPHCLGVKLSTANELFSEKGNSPDTVAMVYDNYSSKLVVIYNDHSLYTWDLKNLSQIGKVYSCLYHNACIWDISVYSPTVNQDKVPLPLTSFITCSSDNTIRFWSLENGEFCFKNIYSKELIRVIYDIEDTTCLRDTSKLPGDCTVVSDATRGTRCIEIHPLGHHMAAGDRQGNLKIYDLNFMDKIHDIMAHDSEILSITYSIYRENSTMWLATGSRDRLIHLFDVTAGYNHTHTILDHSAAITSVKFIVNHDSTVHLVSCGADKSLIVQELVTTASKIPSIKRVNHIVEKSTMYDMIVDPTLKTISTVGQDKLVRIYNASSCKQKLMYKGGASEEGSGLLKVAIDPSGLFIATSGSDKIVCVFEYFTGECITKLYGHSEVITALEFSSCCQYLYTASGDSCIFVWKLSTELTQRMHSHLAEIGQLNKVPDYNNSDRYKTRKDTYCVSTSTAITSTSVIEDSDDTDTIDEEIVDDNTFEFGLNQLPAWAQQRCGMNTEQTMDMQSHVDHVTGKWAERLDDDMKILSTESFSEMSELESDQTVLEFGKIKLEDLQMEIEEPLQDEEEVVYPVHGRESVDPSMFKVSTPERKLPVTFPLGSNIPDIVVDISDSNDEEIEDDDDTIAPNEEMFLKTNFESLSLADALFQPQEVGGSGQHHLLSPGRPSLSTMYLNKSRSRLGCSQSSIIPLPIDITTPLTNELLMDTATVTQESDTKNSIVLTTPQSVYSDECGDSECSTSKTESILADKEAFSSNNKTTSDDTLSSDSHVTDSSGGLQSRPRPLPSDKKMTKSKITSEEISKARKRLEELGYSTEYIRGGKRRRQVEMSEEKEGLLVDGLYDSSSKENRSDTGAYEQIKSREKIMTEKDNGGDEIRLMVLDQIDTVETNVSKLTSTVEQMMPTHASLLLDDCTSAITMIRQYCVRLEQILQDKTNTEQSSPPCSVTVNDNQSPTQPYLRSSEAACTISERDSFQNPLLDQIKGEQQTLNKTQLEDPLLTDLINTTQEPQNMHMNSTDPVVILTNTQEPQNVSISSPDPLPITTNEPQDIYTSSTDLTDPNVPMTIDNSVILDPAVIKPLLESYSQQLIEAVKLKLSTIK